MVVVGAKGHAKEVLGLLHDLGQTDNLFFFDNLSSDIGDKLYGRFKIIKSYQELEKAFLLDNRFILGLGNPLHRFNMGENLIKNGGVLESIISISARIGSYDVEIGVGVNIMNNVNITSSIQIGKGVLINANSSIHHDVIIGDYVEVAPNVTITGGCTIGSFSSIGAGATILPKVTIGKNVIIGAGSVVTKDIEDNLTVVGVPARQIKLLQTSSF